MIGGWDVPFWLVFGKDLPLGMVADHFDIDEAAQIELLRSEHRHDGGCSGYKVNEEMVEMRFEVQ